MYNSYFVKMLLAVGALSLSTGCQSKFFQDMVAGNPNSFKKMDSDLPPESSSTGDSDLPPSASSSGGDAGGSTSSDPTGGSGSVSTGEVPPPPTSSTSTGEVPPPPSPTTSTTTGEVPPPPSSSSTGEVPPPTTSTTTTGEVPPPPATTSTGEVPPPPATTTGEVPPPPATTGDTPPPTTTGNDVPPSSGYSPIVDTTLRYGMRNTNEGANVMLHVGQDTNQAIVLFAVPNSAIASVRKATLIMTVNAKRYGENSGPSSNWPNNQSVKDYVFAHRLLSKSLVEGNGRLRGHEHVENWNPAIETSLSAFLQSITGNPDIYFRGSGSGVTALCAADSDIDNSAKDCAKDSEPKFVYDPRLADFGATTKVMHYNGMPDLMKVQFDITADVKAGYTGWLLKDGGGGQVRYYSKEGAAFHGDSSLAPKLVIE